MRYEKPFLTAVFFLTITVSLSGEVTNFEDRFSESVDIRLRIIEPHSVTLKSVGTDLETYTISSSPESSEDVVKRVRVRGSEDLGVTLEVSTDTPPVNAAGQELGITYTLERDTLNAREDSVELITTITGIASPDSSGDYVGSATITAEYN